MTVVSMNTTADAVEFKESTLEAPDFALEAPCSIKSLQGQN